MKAPDEKIGQRWASEIVAALPDRLHLAVRQSVDAAPDAEALIDGQHRWTYAGLWHQVEQARDFLAGLGLGPGDRILLVGENGRAVTALILAASMLDVWPAILNARLAGPELAAIAENCRPRRCVYLTDASGDAARHADTAGAKPVRLAGLGTVAVSAPLRSDPQPVEADGGRQVAAMIYTSGTTGRPKGVMLTHRGILYVARVSGGMRQLRPGVRVYGVLPVSHVFGLSSVLIGSLANGASLMTVPRFEPAHLAQALERDRIAILQGVPQIYARLFEHIEGLGRPFRPQCLEYTSAGGAPLDLGLKAACKRLLGTYLHNGYGLTESSPTCMQTRTGTEPDTDTVGPLLPGLEAKLTAPDDPGTECPDGAVGVLWLRGPTIMRGYFDLATETRAVLTEEGWLNTGDLARRDADGQYAIVGRAKELIIHSGFNVYPPEVEAALLAHPDVTLAAVVGRPVPGNEQIWAYVQAVAGAPVTEQALKQFVRARLAGYKRPHRIEVLDTLPATSTGKLKKAELTQRAAATELEQTVTSGA